MTGSPYLTLTYAVLGGLFMGTYPVPIKTKAVLKANVHPVIFQLYKSTVVFLCGFLFLIPDLVWPLELKIFNSKGQKKINSKGKKYSKGQNNN